MQIYADDDTEDLYHPTQEIIHPITFGSAFAAFCIGHFQFQILNSSMNRLHQLHTSICRVKTEMQGVICKSDYL